MMKKGLYAILAALAVFALVMTGCPAEEESKGTPDPVDEKVTITFKANIPTGSPAQDPEDINPKTINKGAAIGALPIGPTAELEDYAQVGGQDPTETQKQKQRVESYMKNGGIYFKGWFTAASGGTAVTEATTFAADADVFAQWYSWDVATKIAVVFDKNFDGSPVADVAIIDKSSTIPEAQWPAADPTRPGTTPGYNTPNDTWSFTGWAEFDSGQGKAYTFKDGEGAFWDGNPSTAQPFTATQFVYAGWEPAHGWVQNDPPAGTDLARAERVVLENSWFAVYKFELPADKSWEDYSKVTVSYMIGDDTLVKTNGARAIRLMGNYIADNFTLSKADEGAPVRLSTMAIANYNAIGNGEFIFDDWSQAWKTLQAALQAMGITIGADNHTPGAWEWFNVDYRIDASRKNGSYKPINNPGDPTFTNGSTSGPFYFGLGLTGQGGGGNTQWIRDVKLVGQTGTEDVIATPLWFKKTVDGADVLYPAFTGYNTTNGKDGYKEAYRVMVDGSQPDPVVLP